VTGYYGLDHPNPNATAKGYPGFWGYASMNQTPRAVVTHTTESFADLDGPDTGAENVANWFQTNDVFALYHTLVDGDSTVRMVPAGLDSTTTCTAFHAAGYNSYTLGVSMALRADSWPSLPADYASRVLDRAAAEVALWCARWQIPLVIRAKADVDAGAPGITGHGILDPGSRSDPDGAAFPWDDYLARIKAASGGGGAQPPGHDDYEEEFEMVACEDVRGNFWVFDGWTYKLAFKAGTSWDNVVNPWFVQAANAGLLKANKDGSPFLGKVPDSLFAPKILQDVT
jgi:hypothetical protein